MQACSLGVLTPRAHLPGRSATDLGVKPTSPCNNIELRKATRHLGQLFDDIVGSSGLRAAQQGLLFFIGSQDGPTMKGMAKAIVMDLSALGQTLKPLIRDGYVKLVPCEKDGRAKRVYLTAAGRDKAREGVDLWRTAQGRFEAVLGADRSRDLREILAFISSDGFADAFRAAVPRQPFMEVDADLSLPA